MPNLNIEQPIYTNGRFSVLPLVSFLVICKEGRKLQTFSVEEIDEAVQTVDDMAKSEGEFSHVSM